VYQINYRNIKNIYIMIKYNTILIKYIIYIILTGIPLLYLHVSLTLKTHIIIIIAITNILFFNIYNIILYF